MATKRESYEIASSGGLIGYGQEAMCVLFTAEESYSALYPKIRGKRYGTFTTVVVTLELVADGKPSGIALASKSVAGNLIPLTDTLMTFTFDTPYIVEIGIQYAIVVTVIGAADEGFNYFDWHIHNTAPSQWWRGVWNVPAAGTWTMYQSRAMYFEMWGDDLGISTPTLDYPTNLLTDVYLNSDGLLQMQWSDVDDEDIEFYTVYFGFKGETLVAQNDRSRYSIISLFMFLGEPLEYDTDYEWGVRKTIHGQDYDSAVFEFKTVALAPPSASGSPGAENGLNGIVTIKRLVAAAENKIWYET
jgi:hypothetical protein